MSEVRITAEPRTEFGKGGARRTRRAGKVPAVLYGHGTDPRHISLPSRDFEHALRTDGANVLLSLELDGGSELALPKSIQRNPVRGEIEHVDLILVRRGEKITVEVPVTVSGEVIGGGLVDHQLTTLSVAAEATHIPTGFEVSIDGLEIGASVHAKDVVLPAGTELAGDPEAVVVHILAAPTAEQLEAELAEAEADLGAGTAGAAAAAEGESGEGDIVPDTESGEGGPAEGQGAADSE
ncbi:MAG TPA: 50S ribosomal protein L25/general stress protein Ctc [Mycobacteriales bacterium]|nr:50S ribosomal protein L25/general stress protein Ctc [Mycobacteriales bacterium]